MPEIKGSSDPGNNKDTISMDIGGLIQALRDEDQQVIDQNLGELIELEGNILSGVYFMRHGFDYYQRLMGVQALAGFYRSRGEIIASMELASALFEVLAQDEVVLSREREDVNMMAANVLDLLASNLAAVGHAQKVVKASNHWAEWIAKTGMQDYYLGQIRLCQAEAMIMAGEYEQAQDCLQLLTGLKLKNSQGPILERLVNKLPVMLRAMDEAIPPPLDFEKILNQSLDVLAELNPKLKIPKTKASFKVIENAAVGIGFTKPAVSVEGIIQQCHSLNNSGNPQGALIGLTSGLSDFIQDENQSHDREKLAALIKPLGVAMDYATQYEFWEDWVTLAWLCSIALIRTDALIEAATILRELRDEINRRRVAVTDPRSRAGVSVYLPHLYTQSVKVLYQLGPDYDKEYLQVIEEAKSKILAEVAGIRPEIHRETTFDAFRQYEVDVFGELVQVLRTSKAEAHYITALIDDDITYLAAVNKIGGVEKRRIPLTSETIQTAAHHLRELCNGSLSNLALSRPMDPNDPWRRPFEPIVKALNPFADVLADYAKQSEVLCLSLDGPLFNIPLQMLESKGSALVHKTPITVVPSMEILINCAKQQQAVEHYSQAIAYSIPQRNEQGEQEKEAFADIIQSLSKAIPTVTRSDEQATFKQFTTDVTPAQIQLIAGHGKFNAADPLNQSGVYFSADESHPGAADEAVHLVTPDQIASIKMLGCHVDLLACVSGETTSITSREALGMIWALFQAGSSSIMASAWKVNINSAKDLLKTFYRYWLQKNMPLYLAHQKIMQEVRNTNEIWRHPYHWAPFVLYGYWE
jgi:tetratricopeptide (TPR) repeat protein